MNNLITIQNVRGYIDEIGTAHLNLEDVARGLGFIKKDIKNDVEYIRVDKSRVLGYLESFGNKFPKIEDEFIPENLFYKLCMKANNDVARKFQDVVCDEILPEIRKNGGYIVAGDEESEESILAKALIIAQKTLARREEKIKELSNKIEADKPRVGFAETIEKSSDCILVREFSKILGNEGINLGEKKLYKWLREKGYILKNSTEPTQLSIEKGFFKVIERNIKTITGEMISKTSKITGKGQLYFLSMIKEELSKGDDING